MRAAVYERYGPPEVVSVREVPMPEYGADDVRVRVRATTITSADWRARALELPRGFGLLGRLVFGVRGPRKSILGSEAAGVVEAVGANVDRFVPGDEVVVFDGFQMGCHAEYKVIPQDRAIVRKPGALTFEQAAPLAFGGTTALHFLRKGDVKAGERVLVNGASGAVGSAVVQLARHQGALVTGVCSGSNAELVRSLGAGRVIDYKRDDFTAGGETWDVIVDCAGTAGFARSRRALAKGGRLLVVLGDFVEAFASPWRSATSGHKVVAGPAPENVEDLRTLADLAAAGAFRPVVDRVYPLDDIVEAHRHVDTGHKRGNVVVAVA